VLSFPLSVHGRPITALAFSPDGSRLLSNGSRTIEIRNPSNAVVLSRWDCPLPKINCLRFDREGRWIAIAGGTPGEHGETVLRSWPAGAPAGRWSTEGDLATAVDFSPGGDRIVVADALGHARVWAVPRSSGTSAPSAPEPPILVLSGHAGPILAVAWSPSNDVITTAGADRSLKVWSASDGRLVRTFHHHTEAPNVLAFRPDSPTSVPASTSVCASGADDRTVRIWQPAIGRMVRIIRHHQAAILTLAWLPDGQSLLSAGVEGLVRRLDASSDRILSEWRMSEDWILALAILPDGSRVAVGDATGRITFQSLAPWP